MKLGKQSSDIRGGYRYFAVIQGWKTMVGQQEARQILVDAVQQAEKNLIEWSKQGKLTIPDDPFDALMALVIHTGFVINGGNELKMSTLEILQMQWFIVTAENYEPSKEFLFTKDQMREALEATG